MTRHPDYQGEERRVYANGNGNLLSGFPWWVRAIAVIGIPGAIAGFMVYIMAMSIPSMQKEITVLGQEHIQMQRVVIDQNEQNKRLYGIMQQVCANTSKDSLKERLCFDR